MLKKSPLLSLLVLFYTIGGASINAMDDSITQAQPQKEKEQTSKMSVAQLVDSISEKLVSKELTFNSPVPKELYNFFKCGLLTAQKVLKKKDVNRLPQLVRLQQKAEELHENGSLTSSWLLYLNLVCAELLSFEKRIPNYPLLSYKTLGGRTIEDGFMRYAYIHDNRQKIRNDLMKPTNMVGEYVFGEGSNAFSLSYNHLHENRWLFARRDCFWLPVLSENTLFPIRMLNKAFAHRIGLVGVPFENEDFDGELDQTPLSFAIHDVVHASVFDTEPNFLEPEEEPEDKFTTFDFLDLSNDPWISFWYQLWQTIDKSPPDEYVFFDMFHEVGDSGFLSDYQYQRNIPNLTDIIEICLMHRKKYDHDFSSPELYWRDRLKSVGITEVTIVVPYGFPRYKITLENTYGILYISPQQTNPLCFLGVNNYEFAKEEMKNMIAYFRRRGAPIDPGVVNTPSETGKAYYKFLKETYDDFLKKYENFSI